MGPFTRRRPGIRIGKTRFDPKDGLLTGPDGAAIPLRAQSRDMLRCLLEQAGTLVSRDTLFDAVWPEVAVTDDSLTQCIADIRRAIGDDTHTILRTEPRKGYVLMLDTAPSGPARRLWPALAAGLALALGLGAWGALKPSAPAPQTLTPQTLASILVMPFSDLSEGQDMSHLADGTTEDLIVALTRWEDFRVIDRNSAIGFAQASQDMPTVAEAAGVDYVIEGSVRRVDDTLRITAQLVYGKTGENV